MTWRRVKRLLWLAAWSFWAFIGWRLYVEFPRTLGEPIAKLAFEQGEALLGPIHGEPLLVTWMSQSQAGTAKAKLWHVERGEVVGWRLADQPYPLNAQEYFSPEHGVLLCRTAPNEFVKPYVAAIDFRGGTERALPCNGATLYRPVFHPTKPWVAFETMLTVVVAKKQSSVLSEIVVFDFRTGAVVARRPHQINDGAQWRRDFAKTFVAGTDLLALARIESNELARDGASYSLVVWDVSKPTEPDRTLVNGEGIQCLQSSNGRLALVHYADEAFTKVYDAATGACLYDGDLLRQRKPIDGFLARSSRGNSIPSPVGARAARLPEPARSPFALSADGEIVCELDLRSALDLRTMRPQWNCENRFLQGGYTVVGSQFEQYELLFDSRWRAAVERVLGPKFVGQAITRTSRSVRDLATGRVLYRSGSSTLPAAPGCSWRLEPGGLIHRVPPPVDWLAITVIQGCLASPLLFFYSLRWWGWRRRKETAR